MRHALRLPPWHLPYPHAERSGEDAVVPYLAIGLLITVLSVVTIYLYSATL